MCFGNSQQTSSTTQNYTPASWLTSAAQNNLNYAQNLQSTGFQPYTGQMVANFAPQQQQSFTTGGNVANAATANTGAGSSALTSFLNAGSSEPTVQANTIASQMSPYMNQYVNEALQPQLTAQQNQQAINQQLTQGQATSAGAFGDPRATMIQQNQQLNNSLANEGLVGNAYNAAFNTAIGAGAQDVANNLTAQTTNASLYNTGLQNLLAGSNTAYNQATGGVNLLNTLGQQQTTQSQAGLNAAYNQYLMAEQYPFQTTQLVDQALYGGSIGAPSTTTGTTTQPNNAGYGILGSLIGAGGTALGDAYMGAGTLALLAEGGEAKAGRPAVVGEKGPEVFVPQQSGTVIPFDKLRKAVKSAEKEKPGKRQDELKRVLGMGAPALPSPSSGGFSPGMFGQAA